MRASQEEKGRSHARIVESAARLFRSEGIGGASVADVMREAGLTHGGFYKHFASKEALLAAALDHAFDAIAGMLEAAGPGGPAASSAADFQAFYLSDGHVASPAIGCPVAALAGDVARAPEAARRRLGGGVRRIVALLAGGAAGSRHAARDAARARATRQFAMMVGAVMIARSSDQETAREVLAACRQNPVARESGGAAQGAD